MHQGMREHLEMLTIYISISFKIAWEEKLVENPSNYSTKEKLMEKHDNCNVNKKINGKFHKLQRAVVIYRESELKQMFLFKFF